MSDDRDDIVRRLRHEVMHTSLDAADEIERLRADRDRLDWLDTQCSEGNGRHLCCLPGALRAAIDLAMKGERT